VARRIFAATFGHRYDAGPFAEFLDSVYALDGSMHRDLGDPAIRWRVATVDGEPVGYAKLTPLRAPAPAPAPGSLELQQLYVVPEWQGAGVAQSLTDWAVEEARAGGACELYLTVFDYNDRAKHFYAKNGFDEVGRCTFQLGDRIDDDRVWRKMLCRVGAADAPSAQLGNIRNAQP
jgi:GNAT superfamily N-acetyltransferase